MERTAFIHIRVTPEEKQAVVDKAASARRPLSTFARECLLNKEVVVQPGMDEVVGQLKHIGNNVNQIAVRMNSQQNQVFYLDEMTKELNAVWRSVNSCLPSRR